MEYTLLNPIIKGNIDTVYLAKTPKLGALYAWNTLSKYFATPVSSFAITLEDNNANLYHYNITEKMIGDSIDFRISPITIPYLQPNLLLNKIQYVENMFDNKKDKKKDKEDKKEDDDEDDDFDLDDDTDVRGSIQFETNYSIYNSPITRFMYNPMIYDNIPTFTVPNFIPTIQPVVEVYTATDFWTH